MATRPSSSQTNIVQDARKVLSDLKKHLPAITKADRAKGKTKGVNAAFAKDLGVAIAAHAKALTAQSASKTKARSSTVSEVAARKALSAELKSIRSDVSDALAADVAVQVAFGRGANLEGKETGPLVSAATDFEGAFAEHADAVKPAGVSAARIAKLAKLREALESADEAQRSKISGRVGDTAGKSSLLATIKKMVAQARKRIATVVQRATGGKKKARGTGSTSPRRKVKPRAKKPAATGTA